MELGGRQGMRELESIGIDETQATRADAVFDAVETVLITDVVLVDTVWTLAGRKYRLSRTERVAVLERLFSEPNIRFEDDQKYASRSTSSTPGTTLRRNCSRRAKGAVASMPIRPQWSWWASR